MGVSPVSGGSAGLLDGIKWSASSTPNPKRHPDSSPYAPHSKLLWAKFEERAKATRAAIQANTQFLFGVAEAHAFGADPATGEWIQTGEDLTVSVLLTVLCDC